MARIQSSVAAISWLREMPWMRALTRGEGGAKEHPWPQLFEGGAQTAPRPRRG